MINKYSLIYFYIIIFALSQLPDPLFDPEHQSQQPDVGLISKPDEEESQSDVIDSWKPAPSASPIPLNILAII
jgi:hypothetical protein